MSLPFSQFPGSEVSRPFADVLMLPGDFRVQALVDSGAAHSLFNVNVASEIGIDLATGATRSILHGPQRRVSDAVFVEVQMEVCGHLCEVEVGFVPEILQDYGLLGLSFFRLFTVTFRGFDDEFDLEPIAM